MEATVSQTMHLTTCIKSDKTILELNNSVRFYTRFQTKQRAYMLDQNCLQPIKVSIGHRTARFKGSCTSQNSPASIFEYESSTASEEDLILKNKLEIEPYLNGRCIYLVGMMGSGKTTIGQILAEVLGYSFFDSDKLIEQAAGGTITADIFKLYGEGFFRDNETEVLQKLSSMHRLVVSTGGGAVVRPVNWKYIRKGISIFIDVPLEALAKRLTAIGTASRPLLHHGSGDAYVKTFRRLSMLWEERSEAYTNAHLRVSLEKIAAKLGHEDVCNITPIQIAIEVLEQLENYLKKQMDQ